MPVIESEFLLQKMPGKGGWTFAIIPKMELVKRPRSLWVKVRGNIDQHPFENLNLAPLKDGRYFFPVKTEIRNIIGKQAGDYVQIKLFEDHSVFEIPEEILSCLEIEPGAQSKFLALIEGQQREFVNWIYAAKKQETRAERINTMINKIMRGERLHKKTE